MLILEFLADSSKEFYKLQEVSKKFYDYYVPVLINKVKALPDYSDPAIAAKYLQSKLFYGKNLDLLYRGTDLQFCTI